MPWKTYSFYGTSPKHKKDKLLVPVDELLSLGFYKIDSRVWIFEGKIDVDDRFFPLINWTIHFSNNCYILAEQAWCFDVFNY